MFYFRLTLIWDRVDLAEKILGPLVEWTIKIKDVKDNSTPLTKEERKKSKEYQCSKGGSIIISRCFPVFEEKRDEPV